MKFYFFILLLFTFIIALFISLYSFVFDIEFNKCDMTYMFRYPEFLSVPLAQHVASKFKNYELIVYTEGYDEPVRSKQFRGIPVLFLPGNDGSHKQVRSLASVALRMYKSRSSPFLFDFFAVDFNGEMSALYGPYLFRQSDYVRHAVDHILSLYDKTSRSKIILIGHSMGGLLARHLASRGDLDPSRILLILSLATPHLAPVVNSDTEMTRFYSELNSFWRQNKATKLGHIPVISLGGGNRDIEVSLALTKLDDLVLPKNSLWLPTTSVRDAWASTDHRCIVWCKQVVMGIVRSLFDCVTSDFSRIIDSFRINLVPSTPSIYFPEPLQHQLRFKTPVLPSRSDKWIYRDIKSLLQKDGKFSVERTKLDYRILVKISNLKFISSSMSAVMVSDGSPHADWLFVCANETTADKLEEPCTNLQSVSHLLTYDFPPTGINRKGLFLNEAVLKESKLADSNHLIVMVGPGKELVELLFEISNNEDTKVSLPFLISSQLRPHSLFHRASPMFLLEGAVLNLQVLCCQTMAGAPGAIVQELSSGLYKSEIQYFMHNTSFLLETCYNCNVYLFTNPTCRYRVSLTVYPPAFGARALRDHPTSMITYAALISSGILVQQLQKTIGLNTELSFHEALFSPYVIFLTTVAALTILVSYGVFFSVSASLHLCFTFGVLSILFVCCKIIVVPISYLFRLIFFNEASLSLLLLLVNFLSPVASAVAIYACVNYCSATGVVLLFTTQIIKTTITYLSMKRDPTTQKASRYAYQASICVLFGLVAILHGPSLVVWVKGFHESVKIDLKDPSASLGIWLSLISAMNTLPRQDSAYLSKSLLLRILYFSLPVATFVMCFAFLGNFFAAICFVLSVLTVFITMHSFSMNVKVHAD